MTWDGDAIDLDAYFARIGHDGTADGGLGTLRKLQRGHVTSIPFENLEVMLGRPVPLDVAAVQDKLVRRPRGGWCFEHVRLFAGVLERLGYDFVAVHGRVTLGSDVRRPATHALLRVLVKGEPWICDVGFGGGPLEPIRLRDGEEVDQDGWRFRVALGATATGGELWTLHQHGPDGWARRHEFTLEPQYPIDFEVGNHFVATHPRSPFAARPYVQRFAADVHHALDALTLTSLRPDGGREVRELDVRERPRVLEEVFGIVLDPEDAAKLGS
ncbi:arylamine N-acetyltransferase family protein [Actinomadura parmotrematis]|uniref:Arylamine N-acetyltransferase n=1 Tax=Actinomadura parmotrematis TaxID=2864039 RepID=A0ABS7FZL9_9ACTN|nr:arylamine N-acetyltransferase [Actinomadura parmotrematis]MBW8485897.1 arylamine N-acetyltransferase [Actinomadura parmotrematis]